jgi:hypothetical protein
MAGSAQASLVLGNAPEGPPMRFDSPMLNPLSVTVDPLAAMLNCELADHPVYDGLELQWFDDDAHGTGMLAFLSRRADRTVDYYPQPGLRLDPAHYSIGGGTGVWTETVFEAARLRVTEDGVDAEARFTDVDGRRIEIRVDDRDGRLRRRAGLLAPVGSGIDHPRALMLVWMPGFDLVRASRMAPVIRIDDDDAAIGRLPGARLHRRHLIKYAAPVIAVDVNPDRDGPLPPSRPDDDVVQVGAGIAAVIGRVGGHTARLSLDHPLPDPADLIDGSLNEGGWRVDVDGTRLTGGRWRAARDGDRVELAMEVTQRWRPRRLPWLMRLVTTVAPVFRRWPTTYRWRATVTLGPTPTIASRWERTESDGGAAYRRATGS